MIMADIAGRRIISRRPLSDVTKNVVNAVDRGNDTVAVQQVQVTDKDRNRRLIDDNANQEKRNSQASASSSTRSKGNKDLKTCVGPWELGKNLGTGASASVRKARHCETGTKAAVKIINLRRAAKLTTQSIVAMNKNSGSVNTTGQARERLPMVLQREVAILKAMDHPNVVKLFDIWENRGELYLFMEYVENGELLSYILHHGRLEEFESVRIFRQLISGLQYCHRFLLCHRDVKPENILLDQDFNVKLADFGMAAMHGNQMLFTSCGSPHYAPPEICRGKPYKGPPTDIWSSGVVLYVMLTGRLPFGEQYDAKDVKYITAEVISKPLDALEPFHELSVSAKDLLKKILVRDPEKRLPIARMWRHSLLEKYDGYTQHPKYRKFWIGGPLQELTQQDCGVQLRDVQEIDMAIIEGLCIIWQTNDEDRFVKAILSHKPCYEKVLYHCLHRYRTEQEENYRGPPLAPSSSDHHHIGPRHLTRSQPKISLLGPGSSRPSSQYSLVPPGSRRISVRSRHTARSISNSGKAGSVANTETTYDPYRSSKPQVIYKGDPYTRVDVYRDGSIRPRILSTRSMRVSHRPPVSSIWQSTIGSSLTSMPSSPPELPRDALGHVRTLRHTGIRKSYSKASVTGSSYSQTSIGPVRFHRTASYKRSISFQRRGHPPPRPDAPTPISLQQRYLRNRLRERTPELPSSPCNGRGRGRRSLPELTDLASPSEMDCGLYNLHPKTAHSSAELRGPHTSIEAAKCASSELSRFCDVAFSSTPATVHSPRTPVGTLDPFTSPESAALGLNLHSAQAPGVSTHCENEARNKSLPEPPMREPHALQVQRELARALQSLKKRDQELGKGFLDGAMAEIERMMKLNESNVALSSYQTKMSTKQERRVQSDGDRGRLPGEQPTGVDSGESVRHSFHRQVPGRRFASDPPVRVSDQGNLGQMKQLFPGNTIRLVPESPAVRRAFDNTQDQATGMGVAADVSERLDEPRVVPRRRDSRDFVNFNSSNSPFETINADTALQTIQEDDTLDGNDNEAKRSSGGSKFRSWFRRSTGSSDSNKSLDANGEQRACQAATAPVGCNSFPARILSRANSRDPALTLAGDNDDQQDNTYSTVSQAAHGRASEDSEFPSRYNGSRPSRGFWSLFKRERRDTLALVEPYDASSIAAISSIASQQQSTSSMNGFVAPWQEGNDTGPDRDTPTPYPSLIPKAGKNGEATNWLARLLQVRPASRILSFDASRTRMLKDIRAIFRDWRRYGVRDVVVERASGRVWARIAEDNGLHIKPVEIVVEIFAIVRTHSGSSVAGGGRGGGRGGGGGEMSVARMKQLRGAKSSFDKCAAQLEKTCVERGVLVTDRRRARDMRRCLTEWRK